MELGDPVTDPMIIKSLENGAQTMTPAQQPYTSSILPFSYDASGKRSFDPMNAGLLPGAMSAISAPADAVDGKIAPSYGNPDTINRAIEFTGMTVGPQSPAGRGARLVPPTTPSAEQLKAAAGSGYDAARASPMTVPGDAIASMAQQLQQSLQSDHGVISKTAPKTFAILDELANPPPGAVGAYPGLEAARRGLSTIAGEGGTEGFAAQKAIPRLDSFIDSVAPQAADARANYAAAQRSNDITGTLDRANTGILDRAEARAHASHSGANIDNAIRQRVASFLQNPQNIAGFSQPEIDALQAVVDGGFVQNRARQVGNVFGGGGGLGQLAAGLAGSYAGSHLVGGVEGPALGAMLPTALGMSAKGLENGLARRSLNSADDLIRQNSPLYRAMQPEFLPQATTRNGAVLRAILPGLLAPPPPSNLLAPPQPPPQVGHGLLWQWS